MIFYLKTRQAVATMADFDKALSHFFVEQRLTLQPNQMQIISLFALNLIPGLAIPLLENEQTNVLYQTKPTFDASGVQALLQDTLLDAKKLGTSLYQANRTNTKVKNVDLMTFYQQAKEILTNKKVKVIAWRAPSPKQLPKPKLFYTSDQEKTVMNYYLVNQQENAGYQLLKKLIEQFCSDHPFDTVSYHSLMTSQIWYLFWSTIFPLRYLYIGRKQRNQRPAISQTPFWDDNDLAKSKVGITAKFVEWTQFQAKLGYYQVYATSGEDPYGILLGDPATKETKRLLTMTQFRNEFVASALIDGNHLGMSEQNFSGTTVSQKMFVKDKFGTRVLVFGVLHD